MSNKKNRTVRYHTQIFNFKHKVSKCYNTNTKHGPNMINL